MLEKYHQMQAFPITRKLTDYVHSPASDNQRSLWVECNLGHVTSAAPQNIRGQTRTTESHNQPRGHKQTGKSTYCKQASRNRPGIYLWERLVGTKLSVKSSEQCGTTRPDERVICDLRPPTSGDKVTAGSDSTGAERAASCARRNNRASPTPATPRHGTTL